MHHAAAFYLIRNRNSRDHVRSHFRLSEVITMHLFFFAPLNMDYNQSENELQRLQRMTFDSAEYRIE